MIDKVVILAAGLGNRIARASTTPKPFLSLDGSGEGETFVSWHIRQLAARGVREFYVVGNQVTVKLPVPQPEGCVIHRVLNPTEDINTSGSGHSAWFAWQHEPAILDGRSRVVLMDADILYEPAVLDHLDAPARSSKTLVCADYRESQEEVMVFGEGDLAKLHGKGLLGTSLVGGLACVGEATGMLLWEPQDHARLREATEWCMRYSTAKVKSEHEDITQRMMLSGEVLAVGFRDLLFMECDTPDEYAHLTSEFYPAVRARR
ncbi:MAG: NTP transferase domain-containing protein [Polyangiales bacterium]